MYLTTYFFFLVMVSTGIHPQGTAFHWHQPSLGTLDPNFLFFLLTDDVLKTLNGGSTCLNSCILATGYRTKGLCVSITVTFNNLSRESPLFPSSYTLFPVFPCVDLRVSSVCLLCILRNDFCGTKLAACLFFFNYTFCPRL